MLPPQLAKIKTRLEARPAGSLKREEAELLYELRLVDRRVLEGDLRELREGAVKITSGPGGVCPCCGR